MYRGVPQKARVAFSDSLGASRPPIVWTGGKAFLVGLVPFGLISIFAFASGVFAFDVARCFRSAASHFVLSGSTITDASGHA